MKRHLLEERAHAGFDEPGGGRVIVAFVEALALKARGDVVGRGENPVEERLGRMVPRSDTNKRLREILRILRNSGREGPGVGAQQLRRGPLDHRKAHRRVRGVLMRPRARGALRAEKLAVNVDPLPGGLDAGPLRELSEVVDHACQGDAAGGVQEIVHELLLFHAFKFGAIASGKDFAQIACFSIRAFTKSRCNFSHCN